MNERVGALDKNCSGCGACAIICPRNAITLQLDQEGFYTAAIDDTRCIHCGKCESVCVCEEVHDATQLKNSKVLAAQSKSTSVVNSSTSGGIAYEMAKSAFLEGMGVVGVVYNFEHNRAQSVLAKSLNDIERFRGSKYIQSYTINAFKEMLSDMKKNPEIRYLVFGTPCQIYGIASVLERQQLRDRAVLVDLFCHGVPSYLVWDEYIDSVCRRLNTLKLSNINFRDKSIGWHNFVMRVSSETGEYKASSEEDLFYHAFFDNVLLARACYTCSVRQDISKADIRLGDYWGRRFQAHEDGVSAILILSGRGEAFLQGIHDSLVFFDSGSINEVLASQSVQHYNTIPFREKAFNDLKNGESLKSTIRTYRKNFPASKRFFLALKENSAKLPIWLRIPLRKMYKQIQEIL